MTEERKRLEEAATKYAINDDSLIDSCDTTSVSNGFLAGAEYGYKEAIAMVKEYLDRKKRSYDFYSDIINKHYSDAIDEIINELFKED